MICLHASLRIFGGMKKFTAFACHDNAAATLHTRRWRPLIAAVDIGRVSDKCGHVLHACLMVDKT